MLLLRREPKCGVKKNPFIRIKEEGDIIAFEGYVICFVIWAFIMMWLGKK